MSGADTLETSRLKNFDFALLGMALALSGFGALAIYSANMQSDSAYLNGLYLRQFVWIGVGLAAGGVAAWVDYRMIERFAYPIFLAGVIALALVEVSGRMAGGSQRWLHLGAFNFQPSELMKIAVIILVARILDDTDRDGNLGLRELIKPGLLVAIPFALVAKQPDLGTAGIYMILFAGIALFNGVHRGTLAKVIGAVALVAPAAWLFLLKPYQKKRVLTLLDPEADPMGQGYHIIQSKIAIGSGGLWGKGVFEGTQSKLNFLPEKHTDFIFSVIAEEIGFFGAFILILLFFFLIMRMVETLVHARDKFGALMVAGIAVMTSFHLLYNIGMTLGLFPIVGVPLPFISYGGSAMVTNAVAIGLVLNVSMRRFSVDY
jgi:rod shape determining protein RodA